MMVMSAAESQRRLQMLERALKYDLRLEERAAVKRLMRKHRRYIVLCHQYPPVPARAAEHELTKPESQSESDFDLNVCDSD